MICMPIGGGVIKARTHEDYVGLWDFTTAMFRTAPYRGTQLGRVQLCGPYVSANRQRMADGALDAGADALMWLDADQTFPKETILRLLKHDLPIVGATYRKREAPLYQFMLPCLDGKIQEDRDVVDNLAYLPGGCHLVRKEVYQVMEWPYYRADFGVDPAKPRMFTGEDVFFGLKAREAGFKIHCDMILTDEIGHMLDHEFKGGAHVAT
jgi:hypothetical protein